MSRRPTHPGLHDSSGAELPHRLLEIRGVPTYVYDGGQGPPIVLIHGYGDTADGWRRVVPELVERHRVIALDVPPYGRSGDTPDGSLMGFYKQFFPELLERLEVGRATLIGHSLGGAIALHLSLAQPELVDRLGLVAPAGLGKEPPWWWHLLSVWPLIRGAATLPNPLTPLLVRTGMRRFLNEFLFHDPRTFAPEVSHLLAMHSSARAFDRLISAGRCCLESYTGTLLEDSRALRMPIWLVWGRHDGLVPSEHALTFGRLHPDAAVHVFEQCGHYPQIELPERFNRLLVEWIERTAPPPARPRLRRVA